MAEELVSVITQDAFDKEEVEIYDTGNERAFLSCLMKEPKLMNEASMRVKNTDIFNRYNKSIYETMLYLRRKQSNTKEEAHYDVMSMLTAAKELGREESFLNHTGGMEHLKMVENCPANVKSFQQYVTTILQRSARVHAYRKAREIQIESLNASTQTRSEFVSCVEQTMLSVSANREENAIVKLGDCVDEFLAECQRNRGENTFGINVTFLPRLMRVTSGLRRKQLIILFARPKTGKSGFFMNVAVDVACLQNIPVFYIDTEMSENEQLSRSIARWGKIDEWEILSGRYVEDKKKRESIREIADMFKDAPFYYSPARGISTEELISRCRQFKSQIVGEEEIDGKMRTKPCLIIYDWLKVSDKDSMYGVKEHQELGFIATAIKDIAAELDVPVLAGAQANRNGGAMEGGAAENAESFLADSDRLLRFCTCLIWLRRLTKNESEIVKDWAEKLQDPTKIYNQMLHVVDQRGGPVEMEGIPLYFTGSTISYEERDRMPDEATIKEPKKPTIKGGPQNVSDDSGCGF